MNRRNFMQFAGASAFVNMTPEIAFAASNPNKNKRIVVLVELKGGNDGFNTLVRYDDPNYILARPRLRLSKRQLIPLHNGIGMNPALRMLENNWKQGDMAWIEGVGYPNGNLSHFHSMDVWDSGSTSVDKSIGWLAQVLPDYKNEGLHGIVISRDQQSLGPLTGSVLNAVSMQDPRTFVAQARLVKDVVVNRQTNALAHVTKTQHQLVDLGKQIVNRMGSGKIEVPGYFSKGELGYGLKSVASMILNGVDASVYRVTQNGFDTHRDQLQSHENSLYSLAHGLHSFSKVMKRAGLWDNVLVVTYSEFGRRIGENKSLGTDHGTASTQLVMGGRVKKGFHGKQPDYGRLDKNGNVIHTVDFRSVYAEIARSWWHQKHPWRGYPQLNFVS